jgi:hypothetical protein
MKFFVAIGFLLLGIVLAGPMQGILEILTDLIEDKSTLNTFQSAIISMFPLLYWAIVIAVPFVIILRDRD